MVQLITSHRPRNAGISFCPVMFEAHYAFLGIDYRLFKSTIESCVEMEWHDVADAGIIYVSVHLNCPDSTFDFFSVRSSSWVSIRC